MSEGEVEVASSAYEVLPKEVLAEVGSVKLFSMLGPRILNFEAQIDALRQKNDAREPMLIFCQLQTAGATRMSRSGISP